MIVSFKDKETENIFNEILSRKFPKEIQRSALRKLYSIDAAQDVDDLRIPAGNRLEKLKGNRNGQYSIRVNDQYRICFKWTSGNAEYVEITDYH